MCLYQCHVPIELSRLIYYFLKSDSSTNVFAKVKGKRKREIGLVVPALYMATSDTSENGKRVVKILADEIIKINERYPHFDVIITDDSSSFFGWRGWGEGGWDLY